MSARKDAQREPLPPEGEFARDPMLWVVPALSALFSRSAPSPGVVRRTRQQSADAASLLRQLLDATGFATALRTLDAHELPRQAFPLVVFLRFDADTPESLDQATGLVLAANPAHVLLAERDHPPREVPFEAFSGRFSGQALSVADAAPAVADPDAISATARDRQFGFRWFIPELLKHKGIWREVLIASLVIQLPCARVAAVHPGDHRQGRRASHAVDADHACGRDGSLYPVHRCAHLGAAVPGARHWQPGGRRARRLGVGAPATAAPALLRASAHRRHRRTPARRGDDPRVPCFGGSHADPRPAVPADLHCNHVLVFRDVDVGRAGDHRRHRHAEHPGRADLPAAAQRAVPARRAASGLCHRVRRRHGNGQITAAGASAQRPLRHAAGRLPGIGPAHQAARQHLQHGGEHSGARHDAADPCARRLGGHDHRHDRERRIHDRHAGRVPDVRAACVAADAAAGGALAAVPAGAALGRAARRPDERARRAVHRPAPPRPRGAGLARFASSSLPSATRRICRCSTSASPSAWHPAP